MQYKDLTLIDIPHELLLLIFFNLHPEEILKNTLVCKLFYYLSNHPQLWARKRIQHFPYSKFNTSLKELHRFKSIYLNKYKYIPSKMRKLFSFVNEGDIKNLKKRLTVRNLQYSRNLIDCILDTQQQKIFNIVYKKFKKYHHLHGEISINLMRASSNTKSMRSRGDGNHKETVPLLHLSVLLNQSSKTVKRLLVNGNEIDKAIFWYGTPFDIAAKFNYVRLIKLLLSYNSEFAVKAFNTAACHGSYKATQLLYKYIKLNKYEDLTQQILNKNLSIAAQNGHPKVVKLLLQNGAQVNSRSLFDTTPFTIAIWKGCINTIKILLEFGADIKTVDEYNPPIVAAAYKTLEEVTLLVDRGEDINATNASGTTALYVAVGEDHVDMVRYLLAKGARIDLYRFPDTAKFSVLTLAAEKGNIEIINLLIKNGADVNHVCQSGMTPLHYAVQNNRIKAALLLLENGADCHALYSNQTPFDLAKNLQNDKMMRLLTTYPFCERISEYLVENNKQSNHVKLSLLNNNRHRKKYHLNMPNAELQRPKPC